MHAQHAAHKLPARTLIQTRVFKFTMSYYQTFKTRNTFLQFSNYVYLTCTKNAQILLKNKIMHPGRYYIKT